MPAPAQRREIQFDIAALRRRLADLENGLAEIGTGLVVPEAGMEHLDGAAVGGLELIALEALMLPNQLQELLGNGRLGRMFAENLGRPTPGPPLRIQPR